MPNPIDVGTGLTVSFATSGFAPYLLNFDGPGITRPSIDITHYGTTGGRTFRPGDLYDGGEVTLEIAHDPDLLPPVFSAEQPEVVTITWPLPAGKTTAATWYFSAFVTDFKPTAPLEDKMTANITLKVTGNVTKTASA